jgi:N utilization substance protein B
MLYQHEIRKEPPEQILQEFWEEHGRVHKDIRGYADRLYAGTVEHMANIDNVISELSHNWKISRLSIVDKCILRFAIYEIYFRDDVPVKAAINEAIEVAKRYSGDESGGFINGLLDTIANNKEFYLEKLSATPS